MRSVISICTAVLLLGSLAAFLLMVSVLSIVAVASVLIGLILMFGLGLLAGRREIPAAAAAAEIRQEHDKKNQPAGGQIRFSNGGALAR